MTPSSQYILLLLQSEFRPKDRIFGLISRIDIQMLVSYAEVDVKLILSGEDIPYVKQTSKINPEDTYRNT